MITTEKEWNKLTKKELVHLLWQINPKTIERTLKSNRDLQRAKNIRCYECESIEKKVKL